MGQVMKKTFFGFLMVGLVFIALQVETAVAFVGTDHACYDIDPTNGGRDGHACWPKGEDPSVSVEASGDVGDDGAGALEGAPASFDDGLMRTTGMNPAGMPGGGHAPGTMGAPGMGTPRRR
jgi:hypothetical protein